MSKIETRLRDLEIVLGPEKGAHARSAIGVAELPFNAPVEVEAEVEIGD